MTKTSFPAAGGGEANVLMLVDLEAGVRSWRDEAGYRDFLVRFAATRADDGQRIESAWTAGNRAETTLLVHRLRGAAASMALPRLNAAAAGLEEALRADLAAASFVQDLVRVLAETIACIGTIVAFDPATVAAAPAHDDAQLLPSDAEREMLRRALESDDPAVVEPVLESLQGYAAAAWWRQISQRVAEFDFPGAKEVLAGLPPVA